MVELGFESCLFESKDYSQKYSVFVFPLNDTYLYTDPFKSNTMTRYTVGTK